MPSDICVIARRQQADVAISWSNVTIESEIATVAALLRNDTVGMPGLCIGSVGARTADE